MDGAEAYDCTVCQDKQRAVRSTELERLPRTLNIFLQRLEFDDKTMEVKKNTTNFAFEEKINLSRFLRNKPGSM